MTNPPAHLVFQAYGHRAVFQECAFALLSLTRCYRAEEIPGLEIWIYTDDPAWFEALQCPLPLRFRPVDQDDIRRWRGRIDFVHRVKIEVLREHARLFPEAAILYCDTDIVFQAPLASLFRGIVQGRRFMHVAEGTISGEGNPILRKTSRFIQSQGKALGVPDYTPDASLEMWNAGVLGFPATDAPRLDAVLALTDAMHPHFPKHIVEQYAFSHWMQAAGPVFSAAPWVAHYWNLKELRAWLAPFFEKFNGLPWAALAARSAMISVPVWMQEKARFYEGRSVLQKLRRNRWELPLPDWNSLLGQWAPTD